MRPIRKALVVMAAASLLAGCSGSSKPRSQSSSPAVVKLVDKSAADIVAAATGAATAKGSVHIEITATQGSRTGTIVNDTGRTGGRQIITLGNQHTEIRLVANVGYVLANEASLRDFFEFPAAFAKKYANTWLSFASTDQGFDQITETLDMPTLVSSITLTGKLTKTAVTTLNGTEVIGVSGKDKEDGDSTLYVATAGDPLPVQIVSANKGEMTTAVFSKWGLTVNVAKPSGAVSVSAVVA